MQKIIAKIAIAATLLMPLAFALPAGAAPNPLLCFNDAPGTCLISSGVATLDNTGGGDSGVYTAVSSLSGKTLAQVGADQLSFNYTGTPTAGSPRISLPVDTNADGTTDVYAFIGANLCTSGTGLVDAINNPSCKIFITGGDVGGYTGWAAFVAAFLSAKVGPDVPFVIADDVGLWTVSNVHLGSEVAANVVTNPATLVLSTSATVNGTNGPSNADNTSFWLGTTSAGPFTPLADPTSELPSGWFGVASGAQLANTPFSYAYTGLIPSTTYNFVAWSLVGGIWYPGTVLNFTTAAAPLLLPTVPTIISPASNICVTSANQQLIDWTGSTGVSPILYEYQAFSDSAYTSLIYGSGMTLTSSQISTPGTPDGVYYIRVRAQDVNGTSAWSNDSSNPYKITVSESCSVVVPPPVPTTKDQCMNNGWKTLVDTAGHSFKNQGDCVSFVATKGKNMAAGK